MSKGSGLHLEKCAWFEQSGATLRICIPMDFKTAQAALLAFPKTSRSAVITQCDAVTLKTYVKMLIRVFYQKCVNRE